MRRHPVWGFARSLLGRLGYVSKAEADATRQPVVQRMAATYENQNSINARAGSTTMAQLRLLAKSCDAVANAIQLRINQVRSTPLLIVPMPGVEEGDVQQEITQANEFITTRGGLGGPGVTKQEFICAATEELLTLGCIASYRRPSLDGGVFSSELVDGATIKPLLGSGGWIPQPPAPAFAQYNIETLQKIGEFTADEMRYVRYNSTLTSRYGKSPTELVLSAIYQYISADTWNLSWFLSGDADFTYWEVPDTWSYDEVERFESTVNSMNDATAGQKTQSRKAVRSGPKRVKDRDRKEADFEGTQVHLIRRIANAFGVNASVLGFEGAQYKVSQEGSQEQAITHGEDVTKLLLSNLITDILHEDLGLTGVQAQWEEPPKDMGPVAEVIAAAGTGVVCPNDSREMLGQPAAEGPYMDAYFLMTPTGPFVLGWRPGAEPPPVLVVEEPAVTEQLALPEAPPEETPGGNGQEAAAPESKAAGDDLRKWERVAVKRFREGHVEKAATFTTDAIPGPEAETIRGLLLVAKSEEDVRAAFDAAPPSGVESVAKALLEAVREETQRRMVGTATTDVRA